MHRYRIIRGESSKYRTHTYPTQAKRDAAAVLFAERDNSSVCTEVWDETHPQDEINDGWAMDGVVNPPGHVEQPTPGDPDTTRPHDRRSATTLAAGDDTTVWAFEHNPALPAGWVSGTVARAATVGTRYNDTVLLIHFTDGSARRVVGSAVAYVWDNDAPPVTVRDADKALHA